MDGWPKAIQNTDLLLTETIVAAKDDPTKQQA